MNLADTTMLDFTVDTSEFIRALTAVMPHASKKSEHAHTYRLRCHISPESILVTASDGYTMGAAHVPVIAGGDTAAADAGSVDLSPADVSKILSVFRVKKKDDEDKEALLRLQVVSALHETEPDEANARDDGTPAEPEFMRVLYVQCTDVSGMIPGETLELPMLPHHDHAIDVQRMLARELANSGQVDSFGLMPDFASRFVVAAKAYGANIVQSCADREAMVVVRCGEDFIGGAHQQRYSDAALEAQAEWVDTWRARFPQQPVVLDADE